ncbi:FAD binding domain-containing protein [Xylona heveae TC161]|uniref:FAD binding domain-containing protein n=1 Tax=Xylona heveae (strain CBS 132557 / TC161) TaxID=1328760 RepID=A0A165G4K3_XYLHT|nr:FAD binding domain-containing protein [Xylona heveae TC161]KZF21731.1 FAD binding domain-containing protein [Xylona heveae TC161]
MSFHTQASRHVPLPRSAHPDNPIPQEPRSLPHYDVSPSVSAQSLSYSESDSFSDSESPSTPPPDQEVEEITEKLKNQNTMSIDFTRNEKRRASTVLLSQNAQDVQRLLGNGKSATQLIEKTCCGGGCCMMETLSDDRTTLSRTPVVVPDNAAFRSLNLKLGPLNLESQLTSLASLPAKTISFLPLPGAKQENHSRSEIHPPSFVTPHHPYSVYPAPVYHARELTKPGAEKRTYHFDIDVTDYPEEGGDVSFVVGGAVGVCAPNETSRVDEIFDLLSVPRFVRDKPVLLKTETGRWPTVWGDDQPRELVTTRRELLTWCADIQSYPPTKPLLRLLAEHAEAKNEKKILEYLASAQGQAAFCDLRTGPYVTIAQLLSAFPSSKPPLDHLLSSLQTLMPRFYSLSNDPHISSKRDGLAGRRLIEIAVTVHENDDWHGVARTGVGSGYFERLARQLLKSEKSGIAPRETGITVPLFRGLMANPLARKFATDGPMLLVGAGVGIAPFRGFVQRRLQNANCANKVWVLQGIRDSLVDELYNGEWGVHEDEVKKVVQSRRGHGRYVQEEVRHQADLVWYIINALDGRIFVCGSSKGMGEGVEAALVDVAMDKGKLNREEAVEFWEKKKDAGQYIAETW